MGSVAPTFSTLGPGEANDPHLVADVQQLLTDLGLGTLSSGTYDDATAAAVKRAQVRLGQQPDGRLGRDLLRRMLDAHELLRGRPYPGQKYRHGWIPVSPLVQLPAAAIDEEYGPELDSVELGEASHIVARQDGVTVETELGDDIAIHSAPSNEDLERWADAIESGEKYSRRTFAAEPHETGTTIRFGDLEVDLDDEEAAEVAQALRDMAYIVEDHRAEPDDDPVDEPDDETPIPDGPAYRAALAEVEAILRGRPYPGQRYTHGWIPVDAGLARWDRDLSDKQHLVDAVTSGSRRAGPYRFSSRDTTQHDLADFGNGTEGVVTTYVGSDPERDADADQLAATLARSIGVPGPRKLRVADHRIVSDLIDGSTWAEREEQIRNDRRAYELVSELESPKFDDYNYPPAVKATEKAQRDDIERQRELMLSSPAGLRLGVLDVLLGVDERDSGTIVTGPDGVVPVQSETAWAYADGRNRANEARAGKASKANGAVPPVQRPKVDPADLVTWSAFSQIRSWKDNPLTPADVAWLRERLDAARPHFLRLGRGRWWQFASDRLDAIATHATGTVDLFAGRD